MLPALRSGINAGGNETQRALMGTRGLGSIPGLCLQPQEAERAGPDGLVTGALASLSPHPLYTLWSFAPTCALLGRGAPYGLSLTVSISVKHGPLQQRDPNISLSLWGP